MGTSLRCRYHEPVGPYPAMVVIKTLLDEALERLPPAEREALMREFAKLATSR